MTDKVLSREFFKFGLEIITDHEGNILNIHILFCHKVSTIYRTVEWQTNSAVRTIQRLQENIER